MQLYYLDLSQLCRNRGWWWKGGSGCERACWQEPGRGHCRWHWEAGLCSIRRYILYKCITYLGDTICTVLHHLAQVVLLLPPLLLLVVLRLLPLQPPLLLLRFDYPLKDISISFSPSNIFLLGGKRGRGRWHGLRTLWLNQVAFKISVEPIVSSFNYSLLPENSLNPSISSSSISKYLGFSRFLGEDNNDWERPWRGRPWDGWRRL